jgi:Kef-type K+ transport system membrane component KefB
MANSAILAVSALLVFAYLLDIFGRRSKLPSVVLLVVTGMLARQVMDRTGTHLAWVDPLVPVIGTLGLILIVLEGALDLSLRRDRARMIGRAVTSAVAGFAACVAAFAAIFHLGLGLSTASALLAAMPFSVISSAVAIPSAAGLDEHSREFVIYESSVSDIIGVLVFYAWLESDGAVTAFAGSLFGGGAISLVAAAAAAVGLLYLINRVEGHVRFLPLLAGLILLYAIGKALHLSPLVLVLVCGLLLNNHHLLDRAPPLKSLLSDGYEETLAEFKGLVAELTFAVKSFFFLMLGYWTDVSHMADWQAWAVAGSVIVVIYPCRYAVLRSLGQPDVQRLTWLAPRGLITVLLFLAVVETGQLADFPFGAVMLVVLVTAAVTGFAHRKPAAALELERVAE